MADANETPGARVADNQQHEPLDGPEPHTQPRAHPVNIQTVSDNLPDSHARWRSRAEQLTPTGLATIAATLGTGLDDPERLAGQALELWQACARALDDWPALRLARICARLPQPTFPVTFEAFLELMLPSEPPAERLPIFRRFIADHYRIPSSAPTSLEEKVSGWQGNISDEGYYMFMRRAFLFTEWRKADLATQRSTDFRLRSTPESERAEVAAYLATEDAHLRREACDDASETWGEFEMEIMPRVNPATGRPKRTAH